MLEKIFSESRFEVFLTKSLHSFFEQKESYIFIGLMGLFTALSIILEPSSQLGKSSSKLLATLFSGFDLWPIIIFICISLLLLSSIIKMIELSSLQSESISTYISNISVKGYASFMLPIGALSFTVGLTLLVLLTFGPTSLIIKSEVSFSEVFILLVIAPTLISFFLLCFSFFSAVIEGTISNILAITISVTFFILWCISIFDFFK